MSLPEQDAPPSPILSPPIASAPGPRASALQNLYTSAISHVLKTCSYTNFSACFPTLARTIPEPLQSVHDQFTTRLGESFHKEFGNILEERSVVSSLNELDQLVEEARKRKEKAAAKCAEGKIDASPTP